MNVYMKEAILQAKKSYRKKEIPVGAVIVRNKKIIAKAYNQRQSYNNVLNHAEILVILKAAHKLKDWRLFDCELYVTLKPCELCEKVIKESRIPRVYYLVERNKNKKPYSRTVFAKTNNAGASEETKYIKILSTFFEEQRNAK